MPVKVAASSTFIAVSWVAPQDGGSPIRGYNIYLNGILAGNVGWNGYQFNISSSLTAGVTYYITVLAYNDVGSGNQSDSVSIIAGRVPSAPVNVRLLSQNATSISITWTIPDNGGSPITTYKIYSDQNTLGVTFTEIISSTGLVTNYTITTGITTNLAY